MDSIKLTEESEVTNGAIRYLSNKIIEKLNMGQKVLWLVPGGSAIVVAVEAAKKISNFSHNNLKVMLTDERYGKPGHKDSNWLQLEEKGFVLNDAVIVPVLQGRDRNQTTLDFETTLNEALGWADYKIGLFGIGVDGHTAGILPEGNAVNSENLVYSYIAPNFERITITPKAIKLLDEAVVYAIGRNKWPALKDMEKNEIEINIQPAQILKQVPILTIFSDTN